MEKNKSFKFEFIGVTVFALLFSLLNSLHVIIQWVRNPPDRYFTGIAHYFADYFLYVAQFAQGARGNWIFADNVFTNERTLPTWIYWFNVSLGHLGSFIGLSPFATYNISLIVLVFLCILLWYYLSFILYPTNRLARLTCFLFITTASSFFDIPKFLQTDTISILGQFWFSPGLAFNRLGGVPHQVFQTIVLLSVIVLFSDIIKSRDTGSRFMNYELRFMNSIFVNHKSYFLILLSFLASTASPVQMLLFVIAAFVTTLWSVKKSKTHRVENIFIFLLVALVSLLGASLTNREFSNQAVLTVARFWELAQQPRTDFLNLFLAIGPIIFLVPLGLSNYFKKLDSLRVLFFLYGGLSFALFLSPLPKLLGVSPSRFLFPAPYAILAIVATDGINILSEIINRVLKRIMNHELRIMNKYFIPASPAGGLHTSYFILLIFYFLLTVPTLYQQVIDRVTPFRNPQLLMNTIYNHVPKKTVEALHYLGTLPSDEKSRVVLTDPNYPIEVLVPVFSGKASFTGHPIHTLYPDVKESLRQQFFAEKMSPEEAKVFLANHRIGYIIAGPKTQLPFSFLQKVYQNEMVTIFKIEWWLGA